MAFSGAVFYLSHLMSNPKTLTIPYSRHFLEWLDQQQLSLGLTTYQTNRLCLIGIQPDG
ncbi:hypothetical protein ACOKW7_04435 [Limnospira platensis CENA597]|uniref:hypothetical protein n=1 Tax=Limnospira platensis TaxID=118562 RepID=UPI003DA0966B